MNMWPCKIKRVISPSDSAPMEYGSEFSEEQSHYGLTPRLVPESNSQLGQRGKKKKKHRKLLIQVDLKKQICLERIYQHVK